MARTVSDVHVHSISIEDIFALEEWSFNETSREKTSIFVDARHLLSQWVVGFGGLHLSAQVENKNVVFKIFQHELCSSIPNHQFLDMNSHFLTNLAVSRNHETTVVSQTNISLLLCTRSLQHCTTLCAHRHVFSSEIEANSFHQTFKVPRSTIKNAFTTG